MTATCYEVGYEKNRVIVIDDFMDHPEALVRQAEIMAPFPNETATYYPGLRRRIGQGDSETAQYMRGALNALSPLIRQVFGIRDFVPAEASFSMVTTPPQQLKIDQRVPHYDAADPSYFAVLHYLSLDAETKGGTSFFRHRKTGFERISPDRVESYYLTRRAELKYAEPQPDYFRDSDDHFERIARFEARFNRLLIYRGSLLHSGDIPDNFNFSSNPAEGRLTCNIFFQGA